MLTWWCWTTYKATLWCHMDCSVDWKWPEDDRKANSESSHHNKSHHILLLFLMLASFNYKRFIIINALHSFMLIFTWTIPFKPKQLPRKISTGGLRDLVNKHSSSCSLQMVLYGNLRMPQTPVTQNESFC